MLAGFLVLVCHIIRDNIGLWLYRPTRDLFGECVHRAGRATTFDDQVNRLTQSGEEIGACQVVQEWVTATSNSAASNSVTTIQRLLPRAYSAFNQTNGTCEFTIQNDLQTRLGLSCTEGTSEDPYFYLKLGGIAVGGLLVITFLIFQIKEKAADEAKENKVQQLRVEGYEKEDAKGEPTELEQNVLQHDKLVALAKRYNSDKKHKDNQIEIREFPNPLCCTIALDRCTRPVRYIGTVQTLHFDLQEIKRDYMRQHKWVRQRKKASVTTPYDIPVDIAGVGKRSVQRAWDIEEESNQFFRGEIERLKAELNKRSIKTPKFDNTRGNASVISTILRSLSNLMRRETSTVTHVTIVVSIFTLTTLLEHFFPGDWKGAIRACVSGIVRPKQQAYLDANIRRGRCLAVNTLRNEDEDFRQLAEANQLPENLASSYAQSKHSNGDCLGSSESFVTFHELKLLLNKKCEPMGHIWIRNLDSLKLAGTACVILAVAFVTLKIRYDTQRRLNKITQQAILPKLCVFDEDSIKERLQKLFIEAKDLEVTYEDAPATLCDKRTNKLCTFPVKFAGIRSDEWFDEESIQTWYQEQRDAKLTPDRMRLPIAGEYYLRTEDGMRSLERDQHTTLILQSYLQDKINRKKAEKTNLEAKDDNAMQPEADDDSSHTAASAQIRQRVNSLG